MFLFVKLSFLCKLSKNHKNSNTSGPFSAQMHFPTKKPWASGNSTPSALRKTILHVHHQSPIAVRALKEGVFLAARLMKRPKWKTILPKTNTYDFRWYIIIYNPWKLMFGRPLSFWDAIFSKPDCSGRLVHQKNIFFCWSTRKSSPSFKVENKTCLKPQPRRNPAITTLEMYRYTLFIYIYEIFSTNLRWFSKFLGNHQQYQQQTL